MSFSRLELWRKDFSHLPPLGKDLRNGAVVKKGNKVEVLGFTECMKVTT